MISIPDIDSYYGGKAGSGVYQSIINEIPPHSIYCEPFLGAGAIMRFKKPAPDYNIGCDLNRELVFKWQKAIHQNNYPFIVHNQCAFQFLENISSNFIFNDAGHGVFLFLDPPYLIETRKSSKNVYKHEFTREDHIKLLSMIITLPFNIALSCYDNELYKSLLAGWRKITFQSQTRKGTATETLYMNYPEPEALHDYNFIGNDFRERERIKKKIQRHVQGLKRLPMHERSAIIEAITTKV
jgi:DNA adenine methylase